MFFVAVVRQNLLRVESLRAKLANETSNRFVIKMLVLVVREVHGAIVAKLPALCHDILVDFVGMPYKRYEVRQFGRTELATNLATSFFVLTSVTHERGLRLHVVATDITLEPRVLDKFDVAVVNMFGEQVIMSKSLRAIWACRVRLFNLHFDGVVRLPIVIVPIDDGREVARALVALEPHPGNDVKVFPLRVQEHLSIKAKLFVAKLTGRLTLGVGGTHFFLCKIRLKPVFGHVVTVQAFQIGKEH